jgi:ketosteroid isomerase-like protein
MLKMWLAAAAMMSAAPAMAAPFDDAVATVEAFHAAMKRGDSAAAEALLAQDALIFESGEDERSKTEYAAKHLPADIEFSKAVGMEVTRRSGAADNRRAWVATEASIRGTRHGKPVDRSSTETMVLRLEAGSWKIAHIHWSSSPAR